MKLSHLFSDSLETKFWKYFQSEVGNVDSLSLASARYKNISKKLEEYCPGIGIGILMSFVDGKKKTKFFITAYGDKSKFPDIEKLVKKAPQTEEYKIIAFSPASYLDDSLTFNGKTIQSEDIEFNYIKNSGEFDVNFFFPNKPSESDNEFDAAFGSLLYEFLGEEQFVKLGTLDIWGIEEKPANQQTKKLNELDIIMAAEN